MSEILESVPELAPALPGMAVCGLRLNPFCWGDICDRILSPEHNERITVGNLNIHAICTAHRDREMREFYRSLSTFTHPDGAPVVMLARFLGAPITREYQTAWMTRYIGFLALARDAGQRVFYLGSKPGVAALMAEIMRDRYPDLIIKAADGYFDREDEAENMRVISEINEWGTDILFVGMGMPIQEHWLMRNRARINARVAIPLGATADYIAGVIPTPPSWAERFRLLGIFRLFSEPKRLWSRYLVEPCIALFWFLKCGKRIRVD